jgi:eukaryotic-like serine/threonine-protein kinase
MTPERWRQITAIFHGALGHHAGMRVAFLDRACADDSALRAEVEAMLEASLEARRFGETSGVALAGEASPRFEPGDFLGPYRVEELIGTGGMGEVYRAHDPRLDRDIALKVVCSSALDAADARLRLLQEARAAAASNHPNVCTIHEVGEVDDQLYIAMEMIEGEPLDRLIPAAGLPVDQAIELGLQIASAVAHAHERGVVHRDLKPANTLITRGGRAKVLDFGLAGRVSGAGLVETATERHLTQPGTVAGTPAYMAPEQLGGQPSSASSDVWALGVLLYEMVAGARPFEGGTLVELSDAIRHDAPAALPGRVAPALADVIAGCLQKDVARRYRDAGEVRVALEAVQRGVTPEPAGRRLRGARPRLAVLPLQNLSGDAEQEYFAAGTHDALITELARIGQLRVIARASVLRYKSRETRISEVAEALRVDFVLTGAVMRVSDCVRLTVQLIDAANQEHLWAGRYERVLVDALTLQAQVVASIASAIALELTPQEQSRLAGKRTVVDAEAYEAYLKGRFHCYKISREHNRTAREYLRIALQKDPNYALAYAGIAFTWLMDGDAGIVPASEALPPMRAAISRALELDNTLAEVHEISANAKFLYEWDWAGAERGFRRAIELNPNYADAHLFYADFLAVMKRGREAAAELERSLELDPLNSFQRCFQAWHWIYAGRYDDAIAQLTAMLRAEPGFSSAHLGLWGAYYRKGMTARALAEAGNFFAALNDREVEESLAGGDGCGDYPGAMRRAAETLVRRARQAYVPAVRIARLYAHAGDQERAFEWLEKAFESRETPLIHLGIAWDWDRLRADSRFESLLDRMNLPR